MKVILSKQAAKRLSRINEPLKKRINDALKKLEMEPPQRDIKVLSGRDGYRLRIGGYRILFGITENTIVVIDVAPRGGIYTRR